MRWLLVLPLLAAAASLSACSATTIDPVAKAATESGNASTVHVAATISETGATPTAIHISLSGDVDNTTHTSHLDLDLGSLASVVPGADPSQLQAEEVTDGAVVYLKLMPFVAQGLPNAKPWVKVDLAALGKSHGIDLSQLAHTGGVDPAQQLQLLEQASSDFTKVADEQVNGVETTRYHGNVDLQKALDGLDPAAQAKLQPLLAQVGTTTIPYDVWVGDDGLISRISLTMHQSVPEPSAGWTCYAPVCDQGTSGQGSTGVDVAATIDFTDYGAPVTVTVPPSDQVTDLSSLIPAGTP